MKYRIFLNDRNQGVYEAKDERLALNAFGAKFGWKDFKRTVLNLPDGETLDPCLDVYKCVSSYTQHTLFFFVNHANIDPTLMVEGYEVMMVYHDVCDV